MVTREMSEGSRPIAWAVRTYSAALHAYPRALRARYGDEMRATFADRAADAAGHGTPAVAALLVRELADLAVASLLARRRPRAPGPEVRAVAPYAVGHLDHRSDAVTALFQDL